MLAGSSTNIRRGISMPFRCFPGRSRRRLHASVVDHANIFVFVFVTTADTVLKNGNSAIGPEATKCALRLPPSFILLRDMRLMNFDIASLGHCRFGQGEKAVTFTIEFDPIFRDQCLSLVVVGVGHVGGVEEEDEVRKPASS